MDKLFTHIKKNSAGSTKYIVQNEQTESEQPALTLSMLQYPSITWARVFTDGSANKATKTWRNLICITHTSRIEEAHYLAVGETCTILRAEAIALLAAI